MVKYTLRKQIEVQDWDDLIEKTYGKIYSFQQQDGCKGRGIETISVPDKWGEDYKVDLLPFEVNGIRRGVSFQSWLNTSPEETAKQFRYDWENRIFWDRNFYPHVSMIINDLHSRGILEEGEYDIKIDW
jgi:hypothetical protein